MRRVFYVSPLKRGCPFSKNLGCVTQSDGCSVTSHSLCLLPAWRVFSITEGDPGRPEPGHWGLGRARWGAFSAMQAVMSQAQNARPHLSRCLGRTGRCPLQPQKQTSAFSLLWKKQIEKLLPLLANLRNPPRGLRAPRWEGLEDTWTESQIGTQTNVLSPRRIWDQKFLPSCLYT